MLTNTNWAIRILLLVYLIACIWWLGIFLTGSVDTLANNSFGLILGFMPVFSGLYGLVLAKKWGLFTSAVGKAVTFLSLGLISWGLGTLIFSGYYNLYADVEVPYPSLADVGYVLALPLWTIGMVNLAKATGARYGLRGSSGKSILLLVPVLVIVVSYYLLLVVARGGTFDFSESEALQIIFDLLYPLGDVVILAVTTVVYGLSYQYFGGKYKKAIYSILAGFVLMYFADFSFSYATSLETFYVGDWIDFLFTTSMFVLSCGVLLLDPRYAVRRDPGAKSVNSAVSG
jgi:hypothetical protein